MRENTPAYLLMPGLCSERIQDLQKKGPTAAWFSYSLGRELLFGPVPTWIHTRYTNYSPRGRPLNNNSFSGPHRRSRNRTNPVKSQRIRTDPNAHLAPNPPTPGSPPGSPSAPLSTSRQP